MKFVYSYATDKKSVAYELTPCALLVKLPIDFDKF